MSRSKNTIRFSDFSTIPIKLKYTSSYVSASLNAAGITIYSGINGAVNVSGSLGKTTVNYITTRHLYYSNYLTGSNLTTTSSYDNFLQSSAASGSGDWDNRYFPTESNSQIKVISIPRQVYGERISRNGFSMSSSAYQIIDDGNGNLKATYENNIFISLQNRSELSEFDVKEINESEGIIVTNVTYGDLAYPLNSVAKVVCMYSNNSTLTIDLSVRRFKLIDDPMNPGTSIWNWDNVYDTASLSAVTNIVQI
jgi:hypothetical protein